MKYSILNVQDTINPIQTTPDKNPDKKSKSNALASAISPNSMSNNTTPVQNGNPPVLTDIPPDRPIPSPKPSPNRKRIKTEKDKDSESKKMETNEKETLLKTTLDANILFDDPRKSEHTPQIYGDLNSLVKNMKNIEIVQKMKN